MIPDVSVVIPTHNRRALVARTIRSALDQRDVAVEVIVVDDGSSDGTAESVRARHDSRIVVLRHERPQGVSAARNAGIAHARAEHVAFLDDDDLWAPGKVSAQLKALEQSPDAGWVSCEAVVVDEQLRIVSAHRHPAVLPRQPGALLAYNYVPGGGSGILARTALARKVGGFDGTLRHMADWDMWIRFSIEMPQAAVRRPLVAYLRSSSAMSSNSTGVEDDFNVLHARYAEARARHGVVMNSKPLKWFARRQIRANNRVAAARLYARAAAHDGDSKAWGLAAASLVSPRLLKWRGEGSSLDKLPSDWIAEAETWLSVWRPEERWGAAP